MINELFERELRNTFLNDVSLADYINENYIVKKTGHWIEENHDEYELWICSECGAYTELDMSEEYGCGWKFCPNCGAKMIEPQESEVRNEVN